MYHSFTWSAKRSPKAHPVQSHDDDYRPTDSPDNVTKLKSFTPESMIMRVNGRDHDNRVALPWNWFGHLKLIELGTREILEKYLHFNESTESTSNCFDLWQTIERYWTSRPIGHPQTLGANFPDCPLLTQFRWIFTPVSHFYHNYLLGCAISNCGNLFRSGHMQSSPSRVSQVKEKKCKQRIKSKCK